MTNEQCMALMAAQLYVSAHLDVSKELSAKLALEIFMEINELCMEEDHFTPGIDPASVQG